MIDQSSSNVESLAVPRVTKQGQPHTLDEFIFCRRMNIESRWDRSALRRQTISNQSHKEPQEDWKGGNVTTQ